MRRHVLLTALASLAPILGGLVAITPASASPAASTPPAPTASAPAPTSPVITEVKAGAPRTRASVAR